MDQPPFHWRCGLYVGFQSHSFLEWAHATYSLPLCCNIQDSLWWGLIWVRSYPPLDCPGCLITNHSGFHSYICFWHLGIFFFFFFKKSITYFNQRLITLQNCSDFLPYIDMNQPQVYMFPPFWTSLPPPSPSHSSGSSQCTSPEHPASCIKPGLVICFTYGNIHVLVLFSQITPPSSSLTESKGLLFRFVSLLLSHI